MAGENGPPTSSKRQRLLAPLSLQPASAAAGPGSISGGSSRSAGGAASSNRSNSRGKGSTGYKEPGPGIIELGDGATVRYATDLLTPAEAAVLFEQLQRELRWEQRSVRVVGRIVQQPRLIAYQADDPELQYTYSGATLQPSPWHPAVAALKAKVEAALGAGTPTFNSCLLNRYRSAKDSIAWHSDSEPLYGRNPTIASVSLGAPREFLLRCNADYSDKYRFLLGGGALLVMSGSVQEGWMHSVPRRAAPVGERISLTFRSVLLPERDARRQQAV